MPICHRVLPHADSSPGAPPRPAWPWPRKAPRPPLHHGFAIRLDYRRVSDRRGLPSRHHARPSSRVARSAHRRRLRGLGAWRSRFQCGRSRSDRWSASDRLTVLRRPPSDDPGSSTIEHDIMRPASVREWMVGGRLPQPGSSRASSSRLAPRCGRYHGLAARPRSTILGRLCDRAWPSSRLRKEELACARRP